MITSLARTTMLVSDYDEAIAFYRGKLGFKPIVDLQAQQDYRVVLLGLPSQPGVGIGLMQATGDEQQARRTPNRRRALPCALHRRLPSNIRRADPNMSAASQGWMSAGHAHEGMA